MSTLRRRIALPFKAAVWVVMTPVAGATNFAKCCMYAVRDNMEQYRNVYPPWSVCNYSQPIGYPTNGTLQSVTATLGWCKQRCPGTQVSELGQWLQPLATYLSPYIGLLLICPVGDVTPIQPAEGTHKIVAKVLIFLDIVRCSVQEYVCLLGDPASAMWGAFSEILNDMKLVRKINEVGAKEPFTRKTYYVWIALLAGSNDYEGTKLGKLGEVVMSTDKQTAEPDEKKQLSITTVTSADNSKVHQDNLRHLLKCMIEARASFVLSVLIPVVLMLAVTASVFYDAYNKLGDNDTAHGLAYCVWYSWIISLAVAANSFASSLNKNLPTKALGDFVTIKNWAVPLRDRSINAARWRNWAAESDPDFAELKTSYDWKFKTRMLWGHFLGWLCIALPTASAASISYMTPTVGLGCRSFNHLLYGVLTFVVAMLNVFRKNAERSDLTRSEAFKGHVPRREKAINAVYWFLVGLSAFVFVGGTAFQLAGVYRNCLCNGPFASDSLLVEMNRNTDEMVKNARLYWLPVGYVTFSIAWALALVVITGRAYIMEHMNMLCNVAEKSEADKS